MDKRCDQKSRLKQDNNAINLLMEYFMDFMVSHIGKVINIKGLSQKFITSLFNFDEFLIALLLRCLAE